MSPLLFVLFLIPPVLAALPFLNTILPRARRLLGRFGTFGLVLEGWTLCYFFGLYVGYSSSNASDGAYAAWVISGLTVVVGAVWFGRAQQRQVRHQLAEHEALRSH